MVIILTRSQSQRLNDLSKNLPCRWMQTEITRKRKKGKPNDWGAAFCATTRASAPEAAASYLKGFHCAFVEIQPPPPPSLSPPRRRRSNALLRVESVSCVWVQSGDHYRRSKQMDGCKRYTFRLAHEHEAALIMPQNCDRTFKNYICETT